MDWYPETCTFMLYAVVNATRNPPKSYLLEWYRKRQFTLGNPAFVVLVDRQKSIFKSMLNLMVACLSRSQEK
jgi:hypothetical protein